jgi:hypothetical protein
MECKGYACLGKNVRAMHNWARHLRIMHLRARQLRATHVRARHDMVKQVSSRLVITRHVMVLNVRQCMYWYGI